MTCPKCNDEGFINRHANLPDEPCPACSSSPVPPAAEPFIWICLVAANTEGDTDPDPRIRAWTANGARAAQLVEQGLDMVPVYRDSPVRSSACDDQRTILNLRRQITDLQNTVVDTVAQRDAARGSHRHSSAATVDEALPGWAIEAANAQYGTGYLLSSLRISFLAGIRAAISHSTPAQSVGMREALEQIEAIADRPISGTSLQMKANRFDAIKTKARAALTSTAPQESRKWPRVFNVQRSLSNHWHGDISFARCPTDDELKALEILLRDDHQPAPSLSRTKSQ